MDEVTFGVLMSQCRLNLKNPSCSLYIISCSIAVWNERLCYVEGRLRVNVALMKPSWQSSTFCTGGGCAGAHRANDGSMVWSSTNFQLHPWWAVDLGRALYVDGVNLTSRACCGE